MQESTTASSRPWPFKWFGIFRSSTDPPSLFPRFDEFVDPDWLPYDKNQIVLYLATAPMVLTTSLPDTECEICKSILTVGTFRSDGEWLWPDNLAHFVGHHNIVLPDEMVNKIRAMNYIAPANCDKSFESLPWPRM